jgi:hypothetical protein
MDPETAEKERLSIHRYGFLDPLTVRFNPLEGDPYHQYEIIDGEHRFRIAAKEGMTWFPCWVVDVDDDTAMELTAILNELRGRPNENKLKDLLSGLIKRRDEGELRAVMPFDKERFDALVGAKTIDWGALEQKRVSGPTPGAPSGERWVERVYRMPADVAEVVDNAIARAKGEADADNDWQGLEYVCAEYLGT